MQLNKNECIMPIVTQKILTTVSSYNEAQVRLHVIDPILRKLGYFDDDSLFVLPEIKLEYPYFFIGHRNSKKDLPLGFPDYRVGLNGRRGSFVVEAKAATVGLTTRDVEQAHSYAAHSQVGANFFVLCDGLNVAVYETLSGGNAEPVVFIGIGELDTRFHELENVLSPKSLEKFCKVTYDKGLKLCEGLGSTVRVQSGIYELKHWAYRIIVGGQDYTEILKQSLPQLSKLDDEFAMLQHDFELRIREGLVERAADGRIAANVSFAGVTKNNMAGMKLLGIDKMAFATNAEFLSTSPDDPTIFESTADFVLDKGTMMPPMFGDAVPVDTKFEGNVFVSVRLHKEGDVILGDYCAIADYRFDMPMRGKSKVEADFMGKVVLELNV